MCLCLLCVFTPCGLLSVKHNRLTRSFIRVTVNLDTKLLEKCWWYVNTIIIITICITTVVYMKLFTCQQWWHEGHTPLRFCYWDVSLISWPYGWCVHISETACAVLQAASCSALADRVYGGYDSPNVCAHPSFLPPMLVNRWSDGRVEKEWEREREKEAEKKRATQNAKQKEGQLTPHNELQTWQMSCIGRIEKVCWWIDSREGKRGWEI